MPKIQAKYETMSTPLLENNESKVFNKVDEQTKNLIATWWNNRKKPAVASTQNKLKDLTIEKKTEIHKKASMYKTAFKIAVIIAAIMVTGLLIGSITLPPLGAMVIYMGSSLSLVTAAAFNSLASHYSRLERAVNFCDQKETNFNFFMNTYFTAEQLSQLSEKDILDTRLHKIYEDWSLGITLLKKPLCVKIIQDIS